MNPTNSNDVVVVHVGLLLNFNAGGPCWSPTWVYKRHNGNALRHRNSSVFHGDLNPPGSFGGEIRVPLTRWRHMMSKMFLLNAERVFHAKTRRPRRREDRSSGVDWMAPLVNPCWKPTGPPERRKSVTQRLISPHLLQGFNVIRMSDRYQTQVKNLKFPFPMTFFLCVPWRPPR